jgi:16S rRNA (guanine966-N2)-methyltransferase
MMQAILHNGTIMHITGGKLRRRSVDIKNQKGIRPTSAKVREAIFSMIGHNMEGLSFLDSFGGSGIMGMEAWSRGASPVLITEKNRQAVSQIRKQLNTFDASIDVKCIDAIDGFESDWDVIFLDPPYKIDVHPYLLRALQMSEWLVIVETDASSSPTILTVQKVMTARQWTVWKQKHYGASMITIFQRSTSP